MKKSLFSGAIVLLVLVLLFSLMGCSAIAKGIGAKISDEIGKQIGDATEDDDNGDDETTAGDETTAEDEEDPTDADSEETVEHSKYTMDGVDYETGENLDWPSAYMADLPKMDVNVTMTAYNKETKAVVIYYKAGKTAAAKEFGAKLKELGYEAALEGETDGGGFTFSGELANGIVALIMHSGDGTGVITYDPSNADS